MLIFKYKKNLILLCVITLIIYEENNFEEFNIKKFVIKYKKLVKTFIINNKISKKAIKFQKFILRFNIYLELYYYLITLKFVVFLNYIIFFSKDKYRLVLMF